MSNLSTSLIEGITFGITMAIIPGPIFFLIIQRTLRDGALTGLLCGLGAVTADVFYALVAAIGLTFISQFLLAYSAPITILGGVFLIYLGITTFAKPVNHTMTIETKTTGLVNAWFSTFLLTLTNPVTILSYTIIFAGLNVGSNGLLSSLVLVLGVILGASFIVIALVSFLRYFNKKLSLRTLALINKCAGIVLIGFGMMAIGRGILSFFNIW